MAHRDAVTAPSLWRHADFLKLWTGQTVSELGSVVTRTAVPLVALLVLGAGPTEMALLVVAGSLAMLLVGFFAGAWVDRLRRRPLLIALGRDPVAAPALDPGRVRARASCGWSSCTSWCSSRAAWARCSTPPIPAYVPSLIGVDRVVEGNSKLATSSSLAEIGGPGLAGALVQLIERAVRDPRRRDLVRRLGGLAPPHPDARAAAAGADDDDARSGRRSSRAFGWSATIGCSSRWRCGRSSPTSPARSTASCTRSISSTTCT